MNKSLYYISLLFLVLSTIAFYFGVSDNFFDKMYNSDCMYLPSVYEELFVNKNGINGLKLNGQPNFFPDMLVYFSIYALTKNIVISGIIYSVIQVLLLSLLIIAVLKIFLSNKKAHIAAGLVNILFGIIVCLELHGSSPYSFHLLSNGYHTSSFLFTLLALMLYFKHQKEGKGYFVWLCATIVVATLNDRLFLLLLVIPLTLSITIDLLTAYTLDKLKKAALIVFSTVLGFLMFLSLDDITPLSFINQHSGLDGFIIRKSLATFISVWETKLFEPNINLPIILLSFLSFLVSSYCLSKGKKVELNLFSIFFLITILFGPVLLGMYGNPSKFRYSIFIFYFLPIILVINFFHENYPLIVKRVFFGFSFIFLILFIRLLSNITSDKIKERGANYRPQKVKELELIARRYNKLKHGVANYWDAKRTTYLNKENLKVYAVYYPKLVPNFYTGRNLQWYFGKEGEESPLFNFIVLNAAKDTAIFKEKLKENYLHSLTEGGSTVVITREFTYKKEKREPVFITNQISFQEHLPQ